jgi:hypothetical protein
VRRDDSEVGNLVPYKPLIFRAAYFVEVKYVLFKLPSSVSIVYIQPNMETKGE